MAEIKIEKPDEARLKSLGVRSWPVWTKEPSEFPWHYSDSETCYLLEGEVTVEAAGKSVAFGKGDLVVFPEGLDCVWKVKRAVKKHYKFG
ncbi:MAG: cupin domain-containing protein [Elusimicrobiota bacterium]